MSYLKESLMLPSQLINVLQSNVAMPLSKDKVKRDIQAKLEQGFSHFMPFSVRFDGIAAHEDGKFTVCFKMITREDMRAGFIGDVWYEENGQLNTSDLTRYD